MRMTNLNGSEKYRKAFYLINKLLNGEHSIILLLGMRKTGKTKILTQLAAKYRTALVDFRKEADGEKAFLAAIVKADKTPETIKQIHRNHQNGFYAPWVQYGLRSF